MCDSPVKLAVFLQNILQESFSKFYFKQCSLKKIPKILILQRQCMKMCFHGNQHPWAIKHPFISLYSKYQFHKFVCLLVMNSPVFPSLDDIYCRLVRVRQAGPENPRKRFCNRPIRGPMDRRSQRPNEPNHSHARHYIRIRN